MAHNIYQFDDGRYSFTRRAGTDAAWHHLGGETREGAPIEEWLVAAGMNFEIKSSPVKFDVELDGFPYTGNVKTFDGRRVFYRADNGQPIAVHSNRYQVVQPREILEFFSNMIDSAGYRLNTAGVLGSGSKYWALADTGASVNLNGDKLLGYLLLATAADGTLATTAQFTAMRVVCHNTLEMSLRAAGAGAIKVPHSTTFNADAVKADLGIEATWDQFVSDADRLMSTPVSRDMLVDMVVDVVGDPDQPKTCEDQPRGVKNVIELFNGRARGADLVGSRGTAWGFVNAVTEYADYHVRARSEDTRLNSAWFGRGNAIKNKAYAVAMDRIAA